MKKSLFTILLLLVLPLFSCSHQDDESQNNLCYITINDGEHYKVDNERTKTCERGENLSFDLLLDNSYVFKECDLGSFEYSMTKTILLMPNIQYSGTYTLETVKSSDCYFEIHNDDKYGAISTNTGNTKYFKPGTEIEVSIEEKDGKFICWTINSCLNVGEAAPSVISFEKKITITLDSDINLYANYYYESEKTYFFEYDSNGGDIVVPNNGLKYLNYVHALTYQHRRINTIPGLLYFKRDGYSLVGWNTKEDGTGEHIGLGSRYTPHNGTNHLYAEWKKWNDKSDFEYYVKDDEICLTSLKSNEDVIVIPEVIDGKKVSTLYDAFAVSKPFSTVILPQTVKNVNTFAFIACHNFTTLYFYDSLSNISDSSIVDCPFSTILINAVDYGVDQRQHTTTMADKLDFCLLSTKKRIMVISDSIVLGAVDSKMIYDEFGGEYDVINLGSSGIYSMGTLALLLKEISRPGDIVIEANKNNYYVDADSICKWYPFEANYDLLRYIDLRFANNGIKDNFFSTYTEWNRERNNRSKVSYETNSPTCEINEYGDVFVETENDSDWYNLAGSVSMGFHNTEEYGILNSLNSWLGTKNAKLYKAISAYNINAVGKTFSTPELREIELNYYKSKLTYPIISNFEDHAFTGEYFGFDDFHLNKKGAERQTRIMIDELLVQMGMDGLL